MTYFKLVFGGKFFVFFSFIFLPFLFTENAFPQNKLKSMGIYQHVSTPIKAGISIDKLPLVGEPATLTCTITSTEDAHGTKVQIELPPDTRVFDGKINWEGDLFAGEVLELSLEIAFDTEGNKAIFCRALRVIDADNVWGDLSELYLAIGTNETLRHFAPAPAPRRDLPGEPENPEAKKSFESNPAYPAQEMEKKLMPKTPGSIPDNSSLQTVAEAPAANELTITGRWRFYDRDDTLTSEQMVVEIVRGDNNEHLAWCFTDIDGYYSCGPFSNPNSAGVKSWFLSYAVFSPYDDVLATINPDWGTTASTSNAYVTTTPVEVFPDGTHDIGAWEVPNDSTYERAYWITWDLIRVWGYIWFETGISQNPQETTGSSTVEWKIDSTDGTYYSVAGNIHLTGAAPLSNSIVGHEYAHNIMYSVYGYVPISYCPSPHYVESSSHINCAWTEGWANFLPLVVNDDPVFRLPSGAMLNLETPTWGTLYWDEGDDVEGRVAGALWDIYDNVNDGYDKYCDGSISNIWDVFYHARHDNFSQYWTSWISRGHNISGTHASIYQNTIQYSIPVPPEVTTGLATSVTTNSATLNSTINPNGVNTTYYFEYGITTSYGSKTTETAAGSGTKEVSVSADLTGLNEGTTYHFRLVATNSGGPAYGVNATFTTAITDSDGDGMPDGWEIGNNLNPLIDDSDDDADIDGWTNITEYKKGTDPTDPNSHPSTAMPWISLLLLDD